MAIRWINRVLRVLVCTIALVLFPLYVSEHDVAHEQYSHYVNRYFAAPITNTTIKQRRCLAQAIYYEAGNQTQQGKEAVAMVILNRVNDRRYPSTICGVVRQSHVVEERKICQFSFWCENRKKPTKVIWKESEEIAERVLKNYWERSVIATVHGALYFHADYVKPTWWKQKVYLGKIGNHLFYTDKPQVLYVSKQSNRGVANV